MLMSPDTKGPHSCEEYGLVCCGSVSGALRRYPNSGPGMPSGIRNRYETSSPSILGLDSSWCLVGHLAASFPLRIVRSAAYAVFLFRLLSYTTIRLNMGLFWKIATTYSGCCDLVDTQPVSSWVPESACRGGAE